MDGGAGETRVGSGFLTNGMSGIKRRAVRRGGEPRCLCRREAKRVRGLESGPSVGSQLVPLPFAPGGLAAVSHPSFQRKCCHFFWPRAPWRFWWGMGRYPSSLWQFPRPSVGNLGPICYRSVLEWARVVPVPKRGEECLRCLLWQLPS